MDLLLELFALGLLSATAVRDICAAAHRMAPRPQTGVLAALGGSGRFAANVHRDLVRKLKLGSLQIAEPILVNLPMWSERAVARHQPGRTEQEYPLMLPHELLACMYRHYPQEFEKYILGPRPLEEYWASFQDDDE